MQLAAGSAASQAASFCCGSSASRRQPVPVARPLATQRTAHSMHSSSGSGSSPQRHVATQVASLSSPASLQPAQPVPSTSSAPRQSLDPMAAAWEQDWEAGRLLTVKSPQQFEELLSAHADKLLVLMCKSHACRPCKMFTRKYLSMASRFPECVLAEIYGDETPDTRRMMMQMDVRVTPTFRMYRGGEAVSMVSGTNEKKLMRGILAQLTPGELVGHAQEISDTLSIDEGDAPVAEQQQQPAPAAAGSS